MTSRIAYNAQNGIGLKVADFVNEVQAALAKGRRLKAQLDSMSYGSDFTAVENEIGQMTAGTGQSLWAIVSAAVTQIDSAQVTELARLDRL